MDVEPIEAQPSEPIEAVEPEALEQPEMEPIPIDTTAELLGRAKPRKPRARTPRQPAATPTPRARAAQGGSTRAKGAKKAAAAAQVIAQEGAGSRQRRERRVDAGCWLLGGRVDGWIDSL